MDEGEDGRRDGILRPFFIIVITGISILMDILTIGDEILSVTSRILSIAF
ncbi:hypothetical protein [Metaplanococcus flavidus]